MIEFGPGNSRWNTWKQAPFVGVLLFGLIANGAAIAMGGGGGGGGKPPKDPPPADIDPVFVFEIVDAVDQIGVADLEGNQAVVLASGDIQAFSPSWMANGQDIVFDGEIDGVMGLYRLKIVDDAGNLIINGTPELILETLGAISPDVVGTGDGYQLLTFAANAIPDPAAPADIFLARLDENGALMLDDQGEPALLNVTDSPVVSEFGQGLSPLGDRLAYISDDQTSIKIIDVFVNSDGSLGKGFPSTLVMSGDSTPLGELDPSSIGGLDYSNSLTMPELVVFATVPGSDRDLWIISPDDPNIAEALDVTADTAEVFPSWSPEDSQIVFHRLGKNLCSSRRKSANVQGLSIRNRDGSLIDNCVEGPVLTSKQNPYRHPDWRPE